MKVVGVVAYLILFRLVRIVHVVHHCTLIYVWQSVLTCAIVALTATCAIAGGLLL